MEYETLNLRFGKDLELFRYAQLVNSQFVHFDKITGNFAGWTICSTIRGAVKNEDGESCGPIVRLYFYSAG